MKKINAKMTALLLAGCMVYSSCIGSFSLFNNYADWQRNMTDNKFVNAVVGFVLMPFAGSVCLFVDSVVLNSIEFWTGSNPIEANVGKTQNVMGSDGVLYAVTTLKNGYEVKAATGEVSHFYFDKQTKTWSYEQSDVKRELFHFNNDGTITVAVREGQQLTVTPDAVGLYQVRMAAGNGLFFAMH